MLKLLAETVQAEARAYDDIFEHWRTRVLNAWVKRRNVPPVARLRPLKNGSTVMQSTLSNRVVLSSNDVGKRLRNLETPSKPGRASSRTVRRSRHFKREGVQFYEWELDQLVQTVAVQAEEPGEDSGLGDRVSA